MGQVGRRAGALITLIVLVLALDAPAAHGQQPVGPDGQGTDLFVTIAARECPTYTDIRANRARNNIQQSLKDLGLDTPYKDGQAVDPVVEAATQPNCAPITGWRFTLGTGIAANPVQGPWGSLSVVSAPYATDVTTLASVPGRDSAGRIVPGTSVAGATTIELTAEQAERAGASSRLWLQGGTPSDPVLAAFPAFADEYGFGALRCAVDNLNGDNVEWITFPTGTRHVLCYAYYVTPPPTSGTIVIRKAVHDPPGADGSFTFEGNVSYTSDHRFTLGVVDGKPASATFYRAATGAGDPPWTVRELVPPGWVLSGLTCSAAGASTATIDAPNAAVAIRLVAGDTITCTFTDALRPPPGRLLFTKSTSGGVGTFAFAARPIGGGDVVRATATTTAEDVLVEAVPGPIEVEPGSYRVTERRPRTAGGRWRRTSVSCNAARSTRRGPVEVTVASGRGVVCAFANRFVPSGAIAIAKVTRGGTGTSGFVVSPASDPERQYVQHATTRTPGAPALARGDATRRLPLGRYVIQETGTVSEDGDHWSLVGVDCGGRLRPFEQGRVTVTLTRERPRLVCRFVNAVRIAPLPPPAPAPVPAPVARADVVVTKRALPGGVSAGAVARFEITVRNAGTAAAEQVVVADAPGSNARIVSARASQGRCDSDTPLLCRIGLLEPRAVATVRVDVAAGAAPSIGNLAVAGSGTRDARLSNNVARARAFRDGLCTRAAQAGRAAC